MITNQAHQDTNLWEAWIEYEQFNREHFGTLYVTGEVIVNKKNIRPSIYKCTNISNSSQLILLISEIGTITNGFLKEVVYSEPVRNLNQYTSIAIYCGTQMIAFLDDIEVNI